MSRAADAEGSWEVRRAAIATARRMYRRRLWAWGKDCEGRLVTLMMDG
jgi:hypothetical protein